MTTIMGMKIEKKTITDHIGTSTDNDNKFTMQYLGKEKQLVFGIWSP